MQYSQVFIFLKAGLIYHQGLHHLNDYHPQKILHLPYHQFFLQAVDVLEQLIGMKDENYHHKKVYEEVTQYYREILKRDTENQTARDRLNQINKELENIEE